MKKTPLSLDMLVSPLYPNLNSILNIYNVSGIYLRFQSIKYIKMADQKTLAAENIVAAIEARPQEFLKPDFAKARGSKNSANKYMDNNIVLVNGQKKRLGIAWKMQPLKGGIKAPKDRKYGPTIQFRGSSGDLGKATVAVYSEFKRQITEGINDKSIKAKGGKAIIRSIIQTELESGEELDDPLIRFKLPFKNGKPEFRLVRIEEDKDGNPRPVDVKCTEENVHTLIRSRMVTSGYVNMDTVVFSGFGISIPAKVQLLVIKPVENDAPEVDSILSREEMLAMVGDMGDAKNDNDNDDNDGENEGDGVDEVVVDEDVPATENQLEALRALALNDEDGENKDE